MTMGYTYDSRGRLVCEECGEAGHTHRRRCPYGCCRSPALCDRCWKVKRAELKVYHQAECRGRSRAAWKHRIQQYLSEVTLGRWTAGSWEPKIGVPGQTVVSFCRGGRPPDEQAEWAYAVVPKEIQEGMDRDHLATPETYALAMGLTYLPLEHIGKMRSHWTKPPLPDPNRAHLRGVAEEAAAELGVELPEEFRRGLPELHEGAVVQSDHLLTFRHHGNYDLFLVTNASRRYVSPLERLPDGSVQEAGFPARLGRDTLRHLVIVPEVTWSHS